MTGTIPPAVLDTLCTARLPCFAYDVAEIHHRTTLAASLVDRLSFPIKACPEPEVIECLLSVGCGLDLCSAGDADIAEASGFPGECWKFTSAAADETLLRRLFKAGAIVDADSVDQALLWGACGGKVCGLRVTAMTPKALYGGKFGIPARQIAATVARLREADVRVDGLHLHDQHSNLRPIEFADRLARTFAAVGQSVLQGCSYVNIGGSWPMRHGLPASVEDLRAAFTKLRGSLRHLGFEGELRAEPGRWIVGPCGYWAARVVAVKAGAEGGEHRVLVLDTSTPIPCRPSLAPFVLLRNGQVAKEPPQLTCDIFGSANTALDSIGVGVRLPPVAVGDVIIGLGQGAYTRSLIPPFNEREQPLTMVVRGKFGHSQFSGRQPRS